jgi:hypothetical protein
LKKNIEDIDSEFISTLIKDNFKDVNENITPLKIIAILGIPQHDQITQLRLKSLLKRVKQILKELSIQGQIERKETVHDTLGIKEASYKKLFIK